MRKPTYLEWIDDVSERLAHLAAKLIPDHGVEVHGLEREYVIQLQAHHHLYLHAQSQQDRDVSLLFGCLA